MDENHAAPCCVADSPCLSQVYKEAAVANLLHLSNNLPLGQAYFR